jgi:hypothetical protein
MADTGKVSEGSGDLGELPEAARHELARILEGRGVPRRRRGRPKGAPARKALEWVKYAEATGELPQYLLLRYMRADPHRLIELGIAPTLGEALKPDIGADDTGIDRKTIPTRRISDRRYRTTGKKMKKNRALDLVHLLIKDQRAGRFLSFSGSGFGGHRQGRGEGLNWLRPPHPSRTPPPRARVCFLHNGYPPRSNGYLADASVLVLWTSSVACSSHARLIQSNSESLWGGGIGLQHAIVTICLLGCSRGSCRGLSCLARFQSRTGVFQVTRHETGTGRGAHLSETNELTLADILEGPAIPPDRCVY